MAFQPVIDTVQIDTIYTLNGEPVQNVMYAELEGGYILSDLTALAVQVDAQIAGNYLALQAPEAIYLRTEVRGLAEENDLFAFEDAGTGPGTQATAALPNNVTLSIKKTSGLTGRSARGRLYWIGIPVGALNPNNENLLSGTYVDEIVDEIEEMRINISAVGNWEPVLVSRFTNGAARSEGKTFPWTGVVAVNVVIDTQRGRLPK